MTNSEAISIITQIKGIVTNDNSWSDVAKIAVKEAFELAIKTLEERPQGEWIPVSDRLPEYSGLYLISIYDLVTVANFTGEYFCDRQMDKFVDVFAWQPLPEPYKKGGAE